MRALLKASWLGLLLAACTTSPPLPLLSPLEQAKRYGYSDHELAPDRLEVSFTGPRHRVPSAAPTLPEPMIAPVRAEALDLATWRAAELALARGFKALRVTERQSFVDARPDLIYDWGLSPVWRYPGLVYAAPGYAGALYVYLQARATVSVQLLAEPTGDALDAAETIARLRAAHPGAEGDRPSAQPRAALSWPATAERPGVPAESSRDTEGARR
jgi:hypothetical protein